MNQIATDKPGTVPPWAAGTAERMHELDPELADSEIELIKTYGEVRRFGANELLWSAGETGSMMLVLEGGLDVIRKSGDEEMVIIHHGPRHYVGELITMTGGKALVSGRAGPDGLTAVIVNPSHLQNLIATESDLGEKILLSFILRRMRMIAENLGDITVVGNPGSKQTGDLQSFLSRNGVPFTLVDALLDGSEANRVLSRLDLTISDLPIVLCNDTVLVKPSNRDVADCLGFTAEISFDEPFDLAVIGSGPAGLAAAVYAASEGLDVIVLEQCAPGGQAGSSSKIENYMGFPTGISGQALTGRGYIQAQKFGAKIAIARELQSLECGKVTHKLHLDAGDIAQARSVVIATGAIYRQPEIKNLENYGSVHYGASHIEAQMCRQKNVIVIGGGNSAGQAAVYLSQHAKNVSILIRGASLADSMSDYLIQRINRLPNVELVPHTEILSAHGKDQLESVTVVNNTTNEERELPVSNLFIFIGAKAGSEFIKESIALDDKGFVLTGDAIHENHLPANGWNLDRKPFLLETSCPRVFAAGDVRSGSVKRVASAVGEGSICIQFVHSVLAEQH